MELGRSDTPLDEASSAIHATHIRLLQDATGQGPARSHFGLIDSQLVLTAVGLTHAERRLRDAGHEEQVRTMRDALHQVVNQRLVEWMADEGIEVRFAMSAVDVATEHVITVLGLGPRS